MSLIHACILAIVEGLTEFLPISSTGHMVLVSHFLKMEENTTLATFEIVVQLGAILAVVALYIKKLLKYEMIKKLVVGFIPTGVIGFAIFPHIKQFLQNPLLVVVSMIVGGICILLVENWYSKQLIEDHQTIEKLTYKQALLLGIYQSIAMIPGISRSGAMIVGGLTMRLPRKLLTEFTFLLAVPTMLAATVYTLLKKHDELSFTDITPILLGTGIAFIVALIVIQYFLEFIRSHSFKVFGWYRIVIGIVLLYILL
jgi:undecaprenyl-diphosphatase